jgi:hypothetical protein
VYSAAHPNTLRLLAALLLDLLLLVLGLALL